MSDSQPATVPAKPQRHLVIALDASTFSSHTLDWALDHFVTKDDAVTLLNVFEFQPIISLDLYGSVSLASLNIELEEKGEKAAISLLKQYAQRCVDKGVRPHLTVLKGPVKHSICDFVAEKKPDALIIASRGMGSVKRWFIGSVSDFVVHNCHCPVIVVKEPEQTAEAAAAEVAQAAAAKKA